ncbi:MAG: DUF1343 domain-containing protein [Bacteroidales bacterium]|nr:DUF1343 domain-containing protein [Bacteroidales bacterium]
MFSNELWAQIRAGADLTEVYMPLIKGKNIAVVANHTSIIGNTHLVDSLISLKVNVVKIFGPEHGFRGDNADGKLIEDGIDQHTGLPVISLYGAHRKPTKEDLKDIDLVIFDIQDVGLRFYTFISTMQYVMEACAENGINFLVLDRPNPNGFYIDGPVLEPEYKSFVGMQPVPVVHGMTVAEYARMINEEGWMENGLKCNLSWVKCENWDHRKYYKLPVNPSPNLPNMISIYLYPSLCFFEGTFMSVGRGTDFPFQVYGHPDYPKSGFTYTPRSIPGVSTSPKYLGRKCNGVDLQKFPKDFFHDNAGIVLEWLIDAYSQMENKDDFFNKYFLKLAGTKKLQEQIENGTSSLTIRSGWKKDLQKFQIIRKKYLLYHDF